MRVCARVRESARACVLASAVTYIHIHIHIHTSCPLALARSGVIDFDTLESSCRSSEERVNVRVWESGF